MIKTSFRMYRHSIAMYFMATSIALFLLSSCKKDEDIVSNGNHPAAHTSDVVDKWLNMQLRLMRNSTGIPNHALSRQYAYSGIAAFESLAPGLQSDRVWSHKWNGLTGLPTAEPSDKYYFPANVNAALAAMNKSMFPNATSADKAAIDSLEAALNNDFLSSKDQELINRSSAFGKAVAAAVYNWSETDGYKNAGGAYTPPVGPGLWTPTPPANANALTPYWGNNRPVIAGSTNDTRPVAPIAYSTQPGSLFHNMVKEVYDISLNLTDDQKAMAIFWRDVPGVSSPGHWLSILKQVLQKTRTRLDKAVVAYAITGAAINDGIISCWEAKYHYNLLRPITYIRSNLDHNMWNSHITTPPHPEYPSGHAVLSGAAASAFEILFGNVGPITDHTYDYMGLPSRTYDSFSAIGKEAGQSRVYGGIHFQETIDVSLLQGKKITANIFLHNN
ncbi:MAG TPA: vanadium-dependent haloperoxidase [Chitinophagaceae bacterium]